LTGVYYDVALCAKTTTLPEKDDQANGVGPGRPLHPPFCGPRTGTNDRVWRKGIDIDQTKLNVGAPGRGPDRTGGPSTPSISRKLPPRTPKQMAASPVFPLGPSSAPTVSSASSTRGGRPTRHGPNKHPPLYSSVFQRPWSDRSGMTFTRRKSIPNVVAIPGTQDTWTGHFLPRDRAPIQGSDTSLLDQPVFRNIQCYDQLKVNAILNEIDGRITWVGKTTRVGPPSSV